MSEPTPTRNQFNCVTTKVIITASAGRDEIRSLRNISFLIDEAAKTFTFADGRRLQVTRFDECWISANSEDIQYEFNRADSTLTYPPFHESTPYAPNSPYSASKAGSDHLVRAYHETFGLDTTVTNCSNNYGPYQFPEKLIPLTLINILQGKRLPVYGDGMQVRDWLHVADHCKAIELALTQGKSGEVYNIGGNSETANIQVVRSLCTLVDEAVGARSDLRRYYPSAHGTQGRTSIDLIEYVRDRPGHDRRYAIDYRKAEREIGYAPTRDLQRGLGATIEWYLENRTWWESLLGRDYSAWMKLNYKSV